MNYLSDQNYLNRRSKIWKEYAPFYLDYYDTLQCGFSVSFVEWVGRAQVYNEKWDRYRLLCVSNNNGINNFDIINVKYPNSKSDYTPEELINVDREIISGKK